MVANKTEVITLVPPDISEQKGKPVLPNYSSINGSVSGNTRTENREQPKGGAFQRVTLAWENITVTAPPAKKGAEPKQILKHVFGAVHPGTFLTIMGSSGSGKTTFLNTLTRRNLHKLTVEGAVFVDGQQLHDDIAKISSYVQQDDVFMGSLTVREHLWFMARLRMHRTTTDEEKRQRVEEVIEEMGLTKCADTLITVAEEEKGLSGGEIKRVSFAAAILTKPALLFCDEPTSGLDSFLAQSIVKILKKITETGRTVLCTIHQPSSQVFALFDQILFLAEGRMAYMGPVKDVQPFFSGLGYVCPRKYNPADYYIQTLAMVEGEKEKCAKTINFIANQYAQSTHARGMRWILENEVSENRHVTEMETMDRHISAPRWGYAELKGSSPISTRYHASYWTQICMLMWRSAWTIRRSIKLQIGQIRDKVVFAIVIGLLYWQQVYNQTGIGNINGGLFIILIQSSIGTMFASGIAMAQLLPVYKREYQDKLYSCASFYVVRAICDYPFIWLGMISYTCITYWMIGLNPDAIAFLTILAAVLMMCTLSTAAGHMVAVLCGNFRLLQTVVPPVNGILLLFSGMLLKEGSQSKLVTPISYISPYKYMYEVMVVAQWKGIEHISCEYASGSSDTVCLSTGSDVLTSYNYDEDDIGKNFAICAIFFAVFEVCGFLILYIKSRKN